MYCSMWRLLRDYRANFLGFYAFNVGIYFSIHVELMRAILAIDIDFDKCWNHLWLKIDSQLVTLSFKQSHVIHWTLYNR